jgi:SNF2 family DNA or RNA helicase
MAPRFTGGIHWSKPVPSFTKLTKYHSTPEYIREIFKGVERTRADLHAYQANEAVPFLLANPFSALFIDMGLGKTISSLTVIVDLINEMDMGDDERILVIGPLKVVTDTWPTEVGIWAHTAHLRYQVIREDDEDPRLVKIRAQARSMARRQGLSPAQVAQAAGKADTAMRQIIREEKARSPAQVHFINREQVDWLVQLWKNKWPYRVVFIDESSGFKDHNSTRFKALAAVRRIGADGKTPRLITRMHLLTATPAAETYLHLFTQIYLLDLGQRFGKFITKFREKYFDYNKYSMKYKLKDGAEELILGLIADLCLVMKAKDYLQQPDPTVIRKPVILAPEQLALYREMQENFIVSLPDGVQVEAETAAALSSKLLQMASGVLYETKLIEDWDTGDFEKIKKVHHLHDHKIDTLREMYEELQAEGKPMLVAYHFKSSLARLKKAFPKAVVMDDEGKCIKKWNKGQIPMMLVHPQSAGHGLNLQAGGHHLVLFDMIWSLENYLQVIGRLARQGQKYQVFVWILTAVDTLDELVAEMLQAKEDAQAKLFTILKRLIKKRLKESNAGRTQVINESLTGRKERGDDLPRLQHVAAIDDL